jgi:SAM-dependent methyltransferase
MTSTINDPLKARHRTMWGLGDYPLVADTVIADLGAVLVEESGVRPGDHVLDVAAGSGNAAIPAARLGASVVANDLTPSLLEEGRSRAGDLPVNWDEGDAEALPYADGSFDVVLSCLGVMFAPHHQAGADELVRVCRPGGTIGLLSWTPVGFIGQLFATMKPYVPPPPGASPPPPLGQRGARAAAARRPRHGRPGADGHRARRRLRHPRGVPGVLQGQLRPHGRRVPRDRR